MVTKNNPLSIVGEFKMGREIDKYKYIFNEILYIWEYCSEDDFYRNMSYWISEIKKLLENK